MKTIINILGFWFLVQGFGVGLLGQNHPNLILTEKGVTTIRTVVEQAPLFEQVLQQTRAEVDAEILAGIFVPIPKDMAGGYTHERHKKNFFILQKAGNLYQITGEEKYAIYVRDVFLAYAKMYPGLGLHPTMKSYATGKIFWQCLNDANWLVYCSQAYDCIYNFLTEEERENLETNLFRPLADFISIENPKFFNRIHNHSTWGNAAVGMIGLVMNDEALINRALYGLKNDGLDNNMLDNDGGFIKVEGQNQAGFLAQLDFSFSPDGHFTEGPYYLRYAMTPFLLFARSLANHRPDLKIYDYRDGILKKSIYALLYETDAQGRFFPINDAQKGMSWKSREVVAAVDIAYLDFGRDPMLLSIAEKQGRVTLDEAGFWVALDHAKGLSSPFAHRSIAYRDGAEGKHGGLGILRADNAQGEELCVVAKYAAHGMGHGHFDKLSYSLYDEQGEVVQDYGSARWVNIDQKGGGRYLPENQSFAKQSIAHNTLVVGEESHYGAKVKAAEEHHPDLYFFDANNDQIQIVSAKELHAYPGTKMHRTLLVLKDDLFQNPLLLDIYRVESDSVQQYDLPTWFSGHLLSTNFAYDTYNRQATLGSGHGYQHLWVEAKGSADDLGSQITWFRHVEDGGSEVRGHFFTQTTSSVAGDELILARTGANDPHFNLRPDPVFIQRREAASTIFASVIESHGVYDPVSEIPRNPYPGVESVEVLYSTSDYSVVEIEHQDGTHWLVFLANTNADIKASHRVQIADDSYEWQGPFHVERSFN
ncbi:MAG: heparinase II/III family protein [Bacteroidota bacterium]